ncbi:hypothetical protein HMPREF1872_00800 [Amygdalobacter nucleatus]|uniref:Uncharacterized protein n=1 Tax=Amygdalobacter nucleatus TaxID=3029274 RepID=A0A133YCL2_9FIRM|nr:hypothetical protein HMPREF1872_00800 [Amygdalobacter nucleatus]
MHHVKCLRKDVVQQAGCFSAMSGKASGAVLCRYYKLNMRNWTFA